VLPVGLSHELLNFELLDQAVFFGLGTRLGLGTRARDYDRYAIDRIRTRYAIFYYLWRRHLTKYRLWGLGTGLRSGIRELRPITCSKESNEELVYSYKK